MSANTPQAEDREDLPSEIEDRFISGGAFIDVRAPIEFNDGAVPCALNLPILNDEERHQVGICYKEKGQKVATELGHRLVAGTVKEARLAAWISQLKNDPDTWLYCFRGGQRSRISEEWLKEAGVSVRRVPGGYKALRRYLLEQFEKIPNQLPIRVVSGQTGSGKTRLLRQLMSTDATIVDLEGIARHRGSAFGCEVESQPNQVDFENVLTVELMRALKKVPRSVWFEDESRTIGRIGLKDFIYLPLRKCEMAVIEESTASRARLILEEYVIEAYQKLFQLEERSCVDTAGSHEAAYRRLSQSLLEPVRKIERTLGGSRTKKALDLVTEGLERSRNADNWESHLPWIEYLLENYYDPFYTEHLKRQSARVVFRGSRDEVGAYILEH